MAKWLKKRPDDNQPRLLTAQEEEKIKKVQRPFQPRTRSSWGNAATLGSEYGPKKRTFQDNGSNNGGKEANCWVPGSNQPTFELGTTSSGHNDSTSNGGDGDITAGTGQEQTSYPHLSIHGSQRKNLQLATTRSRQCAPQCNSAGCANPIALNRRS